MSLGGGSLLRFICCVNELVKFNSFCFKFGDLYVDLVGVNCLFIEVFILVVFGIFIWVGVIDDVVGCWYWWF